MNREETKEAIPVMQHFADGGDVEFLRRNSPDGAEWTSPPKGEIEWDWIENKYRIALTKPSADWSLLPKWAKWIARDENGVLNVFSCKPNKIHRQRWEVICGIHKRVMITDFPFVSAGTCDWKDSLVERPDDV